MMRKLLIMLMIVAMASFLFVGCFTEPDEPVDPDEPGEVEICPVVEVASEVEIAGKNYIKGGKRKITVTFAVPTEPVSVYVGVDLKVTDFLPGWEVVMYANTDKTEYTGDFAFTKDKLDDCNEAYIYVRTCETCDYCKYPYTVDTVGPYANIKITAKEACPDEISIKFDSAWTGTNGCDPPAGGCCGDSCSGLASWTIDIYDRDPLDVCNDLDPCAKILYSCAGTACPILCTTDCRDDWYDRGNSFVIVELEDVVGNSTEYPANWGYGELPKTIVAVCP